MPGMPSRWISCCCFGVISRLSQTKPRFDDEPLAHFGGVEIGQHRGEQFDRLVHVDELARLGEQRRRLHVGGEDLAVAVEDIGPRGRDRVLRDAAAAAVAVADGREHHQPQRDHAIDAGEGDDGEAEPRLGLDVAIDVAAVEQRAQQRAASGFRCGCAARACGHRACGAGTLPVAVGRGGDHGADRDRRRPAARPAAAARAGGRDCRIASARPAAAQMALGQALDAARAYRACAHSARSAAMASRSRRNSPRSLATRSACSVESNLIL